MHLLHLPLLAADLMQQQNACQRLHPGHALDMYGTSHGKMSKFLTLHRKDGA